ncbi:MAG: LysM peptidoglycan-binding domain-containing protein [Gammaproteobacteria bacterium]
MYDDHKLGHTLPILTLAISLVITMNLTACSSAPKEQPVPEPVALPEPVEQLYTPAEIESTIPDDVVKPDKPERYIVKKGDTLWDLSAKFLKNPWLWPEMWHINTQIRNPHLIYPGDVILLYYVDGKPYLTLEGSAGTRPTLPAGVGTVKLKPTIRLENLNQAIDTLPRSVIAAFISNPRVLTENEFEEAPYVFSSRETHLINGQGDRVYVRNVKDDQQIEYVVVRKGDAYIDPDTDEVLGYEAQDIADARMVRVADPSTIVITRARKEVLTGDNLIAHLEQKINFNFFPRAPRQKIEGKIIAVYDGLTQIGQFNVVIINRGEKDGMEIGHVLAVYQAGTYVRDSRTGDDVLLPEERAGLLMVFRVFEKLSYGLVMETERALKVLDAVRNP